MNSISARILVVEDLPDVCETVSGLLTDEGYEVQSATSKAEAMEALSAGCFDAAVVDVRLDEADENNRDGLALLHWMQDHCLLRGVIVLTGHADVAMVREALEPNRSGLTLASAFLEKSEMEQLIHYVDHVLSLPPPVQRLISQGENERVEFKSSIRWDYVRERPNKELECVVARTIAGFLNGCGGHLLIGVADDGTVLGLESDYKTLPKKNQDGFQLRLADLVRDYLGLGSMPNIHFTFPSLQGKDVCVVEIQKSPMPTYLKQGGANQFWVRIGNSTRQLDVMESMRYIKTNWPDA